MFFRVVFWCFVFGCLVWRGEATAQTVPDLVWSEDGKQAYYMSGNQPFVIDIESRKKTAVALTAIPEFVLSKSRLSLPPLKSTDGGGSTKIEVTNATDQPFEMFWVDARGRQRGYGSVKPGKSFSQHTYVGHAWLLKSGNKNVGSFRARENETLVVDDETITNVRRSRRKRRHRSRFRWKTPSTSATSPDKKWTASVRDHNLFIGDDQLTDNATADHTFSNVGNGTNWFDSPRGADVRWSPDSKHLIAFQTANPTQPRIHLIESAPRDQLQPKLNSYAYPKPGDELPVKTPRLFSVEDKKEIAVSNELFPNPWSLRFVKWVDDGKKFWLHYNQRGHQVVRLIEVEVATGESRTLIEEKTETFIHYSNPAKSFFGQSDQETIIWASERSGWNHLYRFDLDGKLFGAVTHGDWNVKRIDWVDEDRKCLWFYAVGIHGDQDPYHEHFCRVNFDGTDFRVLTEGDGTHRIQFQQDSKYFLDTWSRVDLAPVTELRDSESGELIAEIQRQDAETLFGDRPLTTRFSAKGRDGQTDIWGIIHWPKNFDADAKYPVVEQIYAGPHDHHVPKSFRRSFHFPHQFTDAGFVVVQIDGMGTAWRSKKFHDVCYRNLKDAGFPDRIAWMKAAAEKYPQMDLERVGIFGGSAGGQNAMAALLWHSDFYKVAVADCGCHDNRMDKIWWNEQWMGWPVDESYVANSNMENASLLKGHLMLTVGELDRNVDPATTIQVVKKLIEANKDFEFVLIPGGGHGAGDSPWAAKKRLDFFKSHLLSD